MNESLLPANAGTDNVSLAVEGGWRRFTVVIATQVEVKQRQNIGNTEPKMVSDDIMGFLFFLTSTGII